MPCAAAAPHPSLQSSAGLQLAQIATTGAKKALLANVAEEQPDASYIELVRLFKARRSVADGPPLGLARFRLHPCLLRVARAPSAYSCL